MNHFAKPALIAVLVTLAVFTVACPKRVSIAEIERDPSRFRDRDVAIAGVVQDSYGINIPGTPLRGGAYKISDGTGSIWVLTEDAVPSRNAEVGVKGRVGTGINFGGRNYGLGMYEKDRRFRRR